MTIALQYIDSLDKKSFGELFEFFFFLNGRINRIEFISGLITIFVILASTACVINLLDENGIAIMVFGCLFSILMIASALSCMALAVKRMHDLNLSGKRLIVGVVLPFVLCVQFFIMCCFAGTPHENNFG